MLYVYVFNSWLDYTDFFHISCTNVVSGGGKGRGGKQFLTSAQFLCLPLTITVAGSAGVGGGLVSSKVVVATTECGNFIKSLFCTLPSLEKPHPKVQSMMV